MTRPSCYIIVPAAGVGRRMQASGEISIPKQYLEIAGKTILQHTLERLDQIDGVAGIVLVTGADDHWFSELTLKLSTPLLVAEGGAERMHSVLGGLKALQAQAQTQDHDWVLVHDAVRPCASLEDISRLRREIMDDDRDLAGGLLAVPVRDTLKKAWTDDLVECTVPREEYWCAATPQMFRYGLLKSALEQAVAGQSLITDEAHAMECAGHRIRLVEGRADNIKITRVEDLSLAEHILHTQGAI